MAVLPSNRLAAPLGPLTLWPPRCVGTLGAIGQESGDRPRTTGFRSCARTMEKCQALTFTEKEAWKQTASSEKDRPRFQLSFWFFGAPPPFLRGRYGESHCQENGPCVLYRNDRCSWPSRKLSWNEYHRFWRRRPSTSRDWVSMAIGFPENCGNHM